MFDYKKYWENNKTDMVDQAKPSGTRQVQIEKIIEVLKPFDFNSVLELGIGFGRVTKEILDHYKIDRYTGLDLSQRYLDMVVERIPKVATVQSTIQDFETDESWDIVLAVEFLMHIPPQDIDKTIKKMADWSRKAIVSLDYYPTKEARFEKLADHNWEYDYKEKYEKYGLNVTIHRISHLQAVFVAT